MKNRPRAIADKDLTIVFQGWVDDRTSLPDNNFLEFAQRTRAVFPKSPIIVSTWESCRVPCSAPVDQIVRSMDPGPLPGIKFNDKPNNINRQIVSARAGLDAVETPFAMKLRTDTFLEHDGAVREFERYSLAEGLKSRRILTTSFFTIDPRMFEHLPFHASDWFQMARTENLKAYWGAAIYAPEDAIYYESHPYAAGSSHFDKLLRTKFAVEQYIAAQYAARIGYKTPAYHNDCSNEILREHDRFIADELIILDPWHAGLVFRKYLWATKSEFQAYNCLMFLDWYLAYLERNEGVPADETILAAAQTRKKSKKRVQLGARLVDPVGRIFYSERVDRFAMLAFRLIRGG